MGQRPNQLTPGAGPWHRWGHELREVRISRRLSQQGLATLALLDRSHLARLERAERPVPRQIAVVVDEVLDACGALIRLWEWAERQAPRSCDGDGAVEQRRGLSRAGAQGHGASAPADGASPMADLASGMLGQADSGPDDADTVVVPCRVHGRILFVPVPRRVVLASPLAGLAATALPAAAAASSVPSDMGSPAEHYTQLRRALIQTDNLIGPRHVLPALRQHLVQLTTRRRTARGSDAVRLLALETRYEELAGWLAQDMGDERTAHGHTARALDASHVTGDSDLTAYILGRKAQLAVDTGHPTDALGLAAAAQRTARPGSRLEVIAVMHQAHAHAVLRDATQALRAYDTALALLGRVGADGVWGSWLDASYICTARARSLAALGHYEQAAEGFDTAIAVLPAAYRRDRGVYLARAARAHAGTGNMMLAARIGLQAVGIAAETGSARIIGQLDRLDRTLVTAAHEQGVAEFREALDRIVLHPA